MSFIDSNTDVPQTLRAIRRALLTDSEFRAVVQVLRGPISNRDFTVSMGSFLAGLSVQVGIFAWGVWWLIPVGLSLQLAGIVGLGSVQHEAWHFRAVSNRRLTRVIAEWILAPLFMNDFAMSSQAHMSHHQFMGEERDPDRPTWFPTWKAFIRAQLKRWLVIPAVIAIARGLASGGRTAARGDSERTGVPLMTYVRIAFFHGLWITIAIAPSWAGLASAYILPVLLGQTLVNIRGTREHVYLRSGRLRSFDTDCSALERAFIGGGFFSLHAVHHVFPEIPQRNQPHIYARIVSDERLRSIYLSTPLIVIRASYFSPSPWSE